MWCVWMAAKERIMPMPSRWTNKMNVYLTGFIGGKVCDMECVSSKVARWFCNRLNNANGVQIGLKHLADQPAIRDDRWRSITLAKDAKLYLIGRVEGDLSD
jgi:hypothetical protein